MGVVLLDMSMSLDGFIAGPNDDVERLHEWLFNGDTRSAADQHRCFPAVKGSGCPRRVPK
jgi:hypothetical protein